MEIKGKNVLFLGDSITEGVGTSSPENNYVSVFQRLSGANVFNYGVSGTRLAKQTIDHNPDFSESFIDRLARMNEDADIVVVFGGTNDFGHGDAPFGTFNDRTDDTYYGACHKLFTSLITKYPDARIVVLTPLHRLSENNTVKEVRNLPTLPLKAYIDALVHVAQYYSLPVIDLYSISGLQPAVEVIRQKYMPDGLHPSDAGAKRIAEILYAQLLSL